VSICIAQEIVWAKRLKSKTTAHQPIGIALNTTIKKVKSPIWNLCVLNNSHSITHKLTGKIVIKILIIVSLGTDLSLKGVYAGPNLPVQGSRYSVHGFEQVLLLNTLYQIQRKVLTFSHFI